MKMEPLPREKTHLRVIVKDEYILIPVKIIKHSIKSSVNVQLSRIIIDNSYVILRLWNAQL